MLWLTHWGLVTSCGVLIMGQIFAGNGLSPSRRQAITCMSMLFESKEGNYIQLKKMRFKMSPAQCWPFRCVLNNIKAQRLYASNCAKHMMTSSNGNIFRVTGHLCREFTGQRWIPLTKASWRGALTFPLICVWINDWISNGEAGDFRRHRAHYGIIVLTSL